jgi:hypothetical protein
MGVATATVKGGFWPEMGVTSLAGVSTTSHFKKRAAQALSKKGMMALREKMETLNGAASGSAASKTLSRIAAAEELGGVRTIETETLVSAEINEDILALSTRTTFGSSPVANGDGNPLGTR